MKTDVIVIGAGLSGLTAASLLAKRGLKVAVTVSGLSAANVILKKLGKEPYIYRENMKNYVSVLEKPFMPEDLYNAYPAEQKELMQMARKCQYCENPSCAAVQAFNIRGLLRRVSVGNFVGAKKITDEFFKKNENPTALLLEYESKCIVEDLKIGEVADYFNAPSFDDAV